MPWKEICAMEERRRFVMTRAQSALSLSELCRRFDISRKTAYKWLQRWEADGPPGLRDRSRRPLGCAHQTPAHVEKAVVTLRQRHPLYSAKKIRWYLERHRPSWALPSKSTIHNILHRHNLVRRRRRRLRRWHPGRPTTAAKRPNSIWSADFKGQFRLGSGAYCFPLTIQDCRSRFLIACRGLESNTIELTRPVFERVFREYGLPERIRTDNGAPFGAVALGRLSGLSAWFVRLGIYPEFIEPGKPQQNGRHENMHGTLKKHTARPPQRSFPAQQRRFDSFRHEFNQVRPHEALGGAVPADLYRPSPRPFPEELAPITYPGHFETRLVSTNGGIRWNNRWVWVSHLIGGQPIGLEALDEGIWDVYFGPIWLGLFFEAKGQILDHQGRLMRHTKL
jgi:transposase InsO family protein